jgi:hypothetical protein
MTSDTSVRLTDQVLPALVTAAQFGPFFRWEPWSPDAGWLPWTSLSDDDVVAQRVEAARETLIGMFGLPPDQVPMRVVASVTFLGWAARIVSPLLAVVVTGGHLPAPRPDEIWWQPSPGGPLPVAYEKKQEMKAEALAEVAIGGLLMPVLDTFEKRFALSRKVLLGNVASALGGAAGMIADQAPERAERAAGVVDAMLKLAPLTGTGTLVRPFDDRERRFLIRHNCCLYYRIPGGGTCGDCVLTPPDERRRGWEALLKR